MAFVDLIEDPLFTGSLGLLAAALDDRPIGVGLLQGLQTAGIGADLRSQRLRNERQREELRQEQRAEKLRQQLTDAMIGQPVAQGLGPSGVPLAPGLLQQVASGQLGVTTDGSGMDVRQGGMDPSQLGGLFSNPQLFEAAAQADPVGTLQSVQSQQDPTNQVQNLRAAIESGLIDMSTSEGRDRAARFLLNEDDPNGLALEQQRAAIEAQQALLEVQQERLSLQSAEMSIDESLDVGFRDLVDLSRINERLEDTLAETGGLTQGVVNTLARLDTFTPEAVLGAVRSMTGTDISTSKAKQLASDLQTFRSKATESLSQSLVKLAEHDVNPTDTKVNVLANTMPSTGFFPSANDRIILDKLETLKRAAEFRNKWANHPLRNTVETQIKKLRTRLGLSGGTRTSVSPTSPRRNIIELPGNSTLKFRNE